MDTRKEDIMVAWLITNNDNTVKTLSHLCNIRPLNYSFYGLNLP